MIILQEPKLSPESNCTYLDNRQWRFEYFFAHDLNKEEMDILLSQGWRKFGAYFFRPNCNNCHDCIPIRVCVNEFMPSKSQRRALKKTSEISVVFKDLEFRDEIFDIYCDHSLKRFGKIESDLEDFLTSFYSQTCPSLQSEFYLNDELIAVGFLDYGDASLSSVYFIYKDSHAYLNPGTVSIIKEIEFAKENNFHHYYLGYWIEKNHSMAYKNNFFPNEKFNWQNKAWFKDSNND